MQNPLGFLAAAALLLAAAAGCDDPDSGAKDGGANAQKPTAAMALVGAGWRSTAQSHGSAWGFSATADDPTAGIRAALDSDMLPSRENVPIAALVNRFAANLPAPAAGEPPFRATVAVAPTPWNDDTVLLLVAIVAAPDAGMPRDLVSTASQAGIAIDFDPKWVAAFRPLGSSAKLPDKGGAAPTAIMVYELSPLHDPKLPVGAQYGALHVRYKSPADGGVGEIVRQLAAGDFIDDLGSAPAALRFAAAVAGFGGLLAGDPAMRDLSCTTVIDLARGAADSDSDGMRAQLIGLMDRAEPLIDLPPPDSGEPDDAKR